MTHERIKLPTSGMIATRQRNPGIRTRLKLSRIYLESHRLRLTGTAIVGKIRSLLGGPLTEREPNRVSQSRDGSQQGILFAITAKTRSQTLGGWLATLVPVASLSGLSRFGFTFNPAKTRDSFHSALICPARYVLAEMNKAETWFRRFGFDVSRLTPVKGLKNDHEVTC